MLVIMKLKTVEESQTGSKLSVNNYLGGGLTCIKYCHTTSREQRMKVENHVSAQPARD